MLQVPGKPRVNGFHVGGSSCDALTLQSQPASAHICFGADMKKRSHTPPEPGEETQAQHIC